jgi:divalent metal cation (Fe/Co/Zn/Cd) transporter
MSFEVIAAVIAGLLIGKSFALLAFAGDSLVELISAYAILNYLQNLSQKRNFAPEDSERTERISLSLLTLLIPVISLGALYSYISGIKPEASPLGIGVSLGAVAVMSYLWTQKKRIGAEANIAPLSIDAIESATCLFMSATVLGGLLIEYFFKISWADYIATAIILGFIILEIGESFQEPKE